MWRSNAQRTGANESELGNRRRWGGSPEDAPPGFSPPPGTNGDGLAAALPLPPPLGSSVPAPSLGGVKREREETASSTADPTAPRKRRSRWGDASEKIDIAGLPTAITGQVSKEELDNYAIHLRLEEINRKLRSGEFVPPERERSPSPPPTYDAHGRRTNTREVRYRKKLEDERVRLVERAMSRDANFRPPAEYHAAKRQQRPQEKVFLPIKEFPEINFFGLLVGPRGNSLKKMERESGAKISIRGRGSVKEGKGRSGVEDEEEEMHCVVMADDEAKVKLCVKLINEVIETAASTPEGQNDHKRNQLRELAALNGTLRDDENQICQNCGEKGHRKFECPQERNWTAHIICHRCGGQGHLARDCTQARMGGPGGPAGLGPRGGPGGDPVRSQFDSEYASLMAELGEGGPGFSGGGDGGVGRAIEGAPGSTSPDGAPKPPPWAAGGEQPDGPPRPTGGVPPWRNPAVWQQPNFGGGGGGGGGGFGRGGFGGRGRGGFRGGFGGGGGGYGQPPFQPQDSGYGPRAGRPGMGFGGAPQQGGYGGYDQAGYYGQPQQGADGQQPDYTKAWEEYYRQQGYSDPAAAAAQGQGAAAAAPGGGGGATAGADGQPDYTAAWEEYYRQQAAAAVPGSGSQAQ